MFTFFKRKKIIEQEITNFNEVLKAINIFILLSEWSKAKFALSEIKVKENESFNILIKKIDTDGKIYGNKEKEKQIKIYKKKVNKLTALENKLIENERKYYIRAEKEKFSIRFNKIKDEIDILVGKGKHKEGLNLLHSFLEENKDKNSIIKYFNKEKKYILKNIEKSKKNERKKLKENTKLEALTLIGENTNLGNNEDKKDDNSDKNESFFKKIIKKINFYKKLKEGIRKKSLLDEVSMLIEENSKVKNDITLSKLAKIHKGLIKELKSDKSLIGYELYGKILGADKISGDTFALNETKLKYNFFLGDATGHGIRAGFIITLISQLFKKLVENSNIQELCFEINNGLKQDLKNRNFITGVFFEVEKKEIGKINFVGMGHEPMLLYRKKDNLVEKIIPGGLAAGIRLIKKQDDIKVKEMVLENEDILITYSDGMIENKNGSGEFYGIEKLQKSFLNACNTSTNITDIYKLIIDDVQFFRGGSNFDDDVSVLVLKRNTMKDIIYEKSEYLQELKSKEGLKDNEIKILKGKNKLEIKKELENIRKSKETERIIKILENLYYTGEILKLKQEAIRFIKEGYIHKKINFFLKKALAKENKYKIDQKNQKVKNKYNVLMALYKKGNYETVIREVEDIISKDGNI